MKWLKEPVGFGDVSQHMVRVFGRGYSRGIFISSSKYTKAAVEACRDGLRDAVFVLCELEEIVLLLEKQLSLTDLLDKKIDAVFSDKSPLFTPEAAPLQ
jgi:restriction system protein